MNKLVNRDKAILEYLYCKYGYETLSNFSKKLIKENKNKKSKISNE